MKSLYMVVILWAFAEAKPQYSYPKIPPGFELSPPLPSAPQPNAALLSAPQPNAALPSAPQPNAPLPSAPVTPSLQPDQSFSTGSFAGQAQAQALVHKHIYVHVPPHEAQESTAQNTHTSAPVQQQLHYKIIFIKAPSSRGISRTQLTQLAQPQTAEKTLVYVLSKKEDSLAELTEQIQQTQAQYVPSKPEVYFIKYKTQKNQEQQFGSNGNADKLLTAPASPLETDSIVTTAADLQANQATQNVSSSKSVEGAALNAPNAPNGSGLATNTSILSQKPTTSYLPPGY